MMNPATNVVKKVTSFFEYLLENLFRDVSNEFQYSADSVDLLTEICFHEGLRFYKPQYADGYQFLIHAFNLNI